MGQTPSNHLVTQKVTPRARGRRALPDGHQEAQKVLLKSFDRTLMERQNTQLTAWLKSRYLLPQKAWISQSGILKMKKQAGRISLER